MAPFDTLLAGYRRFRHGEYQDQRRRFDQLATQGQSPRTMVIACCDSRVDPTRVFDVDPGEIFVLRNVANLVPPYELDSAQHSASAAIEFAVSQLEVAEIIVLGHAQCGGVSASLTGRFDGAKAGEGHFIDRWMAMIEPARDAALAAVAADPSLDASRLLELATVRYSLDNLRSFPFVAQRISDGRLRLRGALFSIADGILHVMDDESGEFSPAAF